MKSIRYNTFETNSSSTHALTTITTCAGHDIDEILPYFEDVMHIINGADSQIYYNHPDVITTVTGYYVLTNTFPDEIITAGIKASLLYLLGHVYIHEYDDWSCLSACIKAIKAYDNNSEYKLKFTKNKLSSKCIENAISIIRRSKHILKIYEDFIKNPYNYTHDILQNKKIIVCHDYFRVMDWDEDLNADDYTYINQHIITKHTEKIEYANSESFTPHIFDITDGDEMRGIYTIFSGMRNKLSLLYMVIHQIQWCNIHDHNEHIDFAPYWKVYTDIVKTYTVQDFIMPDDIEPNYFVECGTLYQGIKDNIKSNNINEFKTEIENAMQSSYIFLTDIPYMYSDFKTPLILNTFKE